MKHSNFVKNNYALAEDKSGTIIYYIFWGLMVSVLTILLLLTFFTFAVAQSSQSGSGMTYSNVSIAGSTTSWANVTNAISSNDVYSTPTANLPNPGDYTDYLQSANFNFSIPAGSTITGITVNVERSDGNGKSKDSRVRIVKGGTIGTTDKAVNPAWGGTDAIQNYGGSSDLWGNSWMVSDINSTGFGVAFAAMRSGGGVHATLAKVDEIFVTVHYSTPLPIALISFDAKYSGNVVQVLWETATETNNDYFTLEKSQDGVSFEPFATIKGAGNSTMVNNYYFTDENPFQGPTYYRLNQTDYDGHSETFKIVSATQTEKQNEAIALRVAPNLFSESFTAQIDLLEEKYIEIQLSDMAGVLIYSKSMLAEKGTNTIHFTSQINFKQGVYLLRILNRSELLATAKVVCTDR